MTNENVANVFCENYGFSSDLSNVNGFDFRGGNSYWRFDANYGFFSFSRDHQTPIV
jgi:hypothetical protein